MNEELSAFEKAKANAREEYADMSLHSLAVHMQLMQAEKEEAEAALSLINAKLDVLRLEMIPQVMDEEGMEKGPTYEGIGRITLTADMYTSVINKDGLYEWLGDNGLDDIIQPTINASTLKAFIKGRMRAGKEIPAEFVKVTPFTRASITKV
jgi:hypothetical protein